MRQGFCIELTVYPFIPVGEVQEAERELEELDAAGSSPASDINPLPASVDVLRKLNLLHFNR